MRGSELAFAVEVQRSSWVSGFGSGHQLNKRNLKIPLNQTKP